MAFLESFDRCAYPCFRLLARGNRRMRFFGCVLKSLEGGTHSLSCLGRLFLPMKPGALHELGTHRQHGAGIVDSMASEEFRTRQFALNRLVALRQLPERD